ncbi:MAG: c-type cytochrome [Bdellovibrionales bacterium]|nr:c-type cytochrome [Bdellovibrionales bacterium]
MADERKVNPDEPVHEIDGIVELNHPAPFWWQAIFYASIVWAIGYAGYYLGGSGMSRKEALQQELAELAAKDVRPNASPEQELAELKAIYTDPNRLASGKAVFTKNCASCHAVDGGGGIGPNLTDKHWLHGDGSIGAILKVVREGVPEKGMPPWGPILKREEVMAAASFVRSLRGTTPAKPKAPQGDVVEPKADF